jgi:LacI family transcriptional regulator
VLNGNRHKNTRVSAATQERILRAARDLRYRPNALAQSLQRRSTRTILIASYFVGSLVPTRGSSFFAEVLDSALGETTRHGYDLTVHLVQPGDERKPAVVGDGRADGCLWIAPFPTDPVLQGLERSLSAPLTVFGMPVAAAALSVLPDNAAAAGLVVEHLYGLGHRRIAHVTSAARNAGGYEFGERREAFFAACAERPGVEGILADEGEIVGLLSLPAGRRPTAVWAYNDPLAQEIMAIAVRLGLSVPGDLSVAGFDSTQFAESATPPLTSVWQPIRAMAARCVSRLIECAEETEGGPLSSTPAGAVERFACTLDVRSSTGPAPGSG